MTCDELLAMPDDGIERWLIRGELRENRQSNPYGRTPDHGSTMASVACHLANWLRVQPHPRGAVYAACDNFKLGSTPDTLLGIDVAVVSADLYARTRRGAELVAGAPVLAVEILSPTDESEQIQERVFTFLETGVEVVWVVDPDEENATVYRPDQPPVTFSRGQTLVTSTLPGFQVDVDDLFDE
jgi:Uma2 family endonuclease